MAYYLISNREVIYDVLTQASSSLVLVPNQTIYVNPKFNSTDNLHITLNGIVFARITSQNPLGINQTRLTIPVSTWDSYFESITFPAEIEGQYEKNLYCHLKYTLENIPAMFGLNNTDWSLTSSIDNI